MAKRRSGMHSTMQAIRANKDAAYANGAKARQLNEPHSACPHEIGSIYRASWYRGWYDVDVPSRIGHVFVNHGVEWP